MNVFDTPSKIQVFRALSIKHALILYDKTKIKANKAYTPTNMLRAAEEITGKKFKRGRYKEAVKALEEFIEIEGATKS